MSKITYLTHDVSFTVICCWKKKAYDHCFIVYIFSNSKKQSIVLTEINKQSTVALSLVWRQRQDARHVIIQERVLFLHQMNIF